MNRAGGSAVVPTQSRNAREQPNAEIFSTRSSPASTPTASAAATHPKIWAAGVPPDWHLYALISKCDDAERRGFPWGAIFCQGDKPSHGLKLVMHSLRPSTISFRLLAGGMTTSAI